MLAKENRWQADAYSTDLGLSFELGELVGMGELQLGLVHFGLLQSSFGSRAQLRLLRDVAGLAGTRRLLLGLGLEMDLKTQLSER